jgi:hypothetical protein
MPLMLGGCRRATPKGLRTFSTEKWASLRMAVTASAIAGVYAALPGQHEGTAAHSRCLARSQLRYVVGDTGFSYIAGFGPAYPTQVHHRDAACTLEEDASGDCGGEKCADSRFYMPASAPHAATAVTCQYCCAQRSHVSKASVMFLCNLLCEELSTLFHASKMVHTAAVGS